MNTPSAKSPPKYVPTLTQVIPPQAVASKFAASLPPAAAAAAMDPVQQEELADQWRRQLVAATQKHVALQMDRRVREAVSQLALEHAQNMLEDMAPTIEATITQVINEALSQALNEVKAKK